MNDSNVNKSSRYENKLRLFLEAINTIEVKKINELSELAKIIHSLGRVSHRLVYIRQALTFDKMYQEHVVNRLFDSLEYKEKEKMSFVLAKSLKLHYLNNMPFLCQDLREFNSGFAGYLDILRETGQDFDGKFTENLNIPYYLSGNLLKDSYFSMDAEKLIINLVFKLFSSSHKVGNVSNYLDKCNELIDNIKRLIDFYEGGKYAVYRAKVFEHMLHGLTCDASDSLDDRIKNAGHIVTNFINYDITHIDTIVSKSQSNGPQEILYAFDKVFARKPGQTLLQWKSSSNAIGDYMYYLYSNYKFSQDTFYKDFKTLNPTFLYDFTSEQAEIKKYVQENASKFREIDIQYLQHNQVGALALVEYFLKQSKDYLFMQVGTGQGKSLITAETAKRILESQKAKQVFIVTCYDHLAERDYRHFEPYYQSVNINATYCSESTSTSSLKNAQVIYTNLETYFNVLRSESYSLFQGKAVDMYYPDQENTALIMDEFDSLILDAEEIYQSVHYFPVHYKGDFGDVNSKNKLVDILGLDKNFTNITLPVTNEKGLKEPYKLYDNWFNNKVNEQQEAAGKEQKITQDALGKTHSFAGSFLSTLQNDKMAGFVHHYLDPLSFYKQFKLVIGFSGSITKNKIQLFNDYCNNSIEYFEIPPFFGIKQLEQNRKERIKKVIPVVAAYLQAIVDEVNLCKAEQPLLIFADSVAKGSLSDFDLIKEKLEKIPEIMSGKYELTLIKEESEINKCLPNIGRAKQITLCTRIMARGVDIKVDKHLTKGLHLILTYYPEHESIYTQMLGRTARQDEPGSYSLIVKKDKMFKPASAVKLSKDAQALHCITQGFFQTKNHKNITPKPNDLRWPLFSEMLKSKRYLLKDDNYKNAVEEYKNSSFFTPRK